MEVSRSHVIAERYVIVEELGRGGMGRVWRAFDTLLERDIALKEIRLSAEAGDTEANAHYHRTLREARAAVRLRHPSIVGVLDVLTFDGRPWIVMELIQGRSVDDLITERGRMPVELAAQVGHALAEALAHAHQAGVIHRDVKPSNVMLGDDGRVILTDFGIATFEGAAAVTGAGTFLGSPDYTAPEIVRGQPASAASDLWSLGACLHAMVEGRPPFQRATPMAVFAAVLTDEVQAPESAGRLAPIISALLHKEPGQRPSGPRLAALLSGREALAWQPRAAPAAPPAGGRRQMVKVNGAPARPSQPEPLRSDPNPVAAEPRRPTVLVLSVIAVVAVVVLLAGWLVLS